MRKRQEIQELLPEGRRRRAACGDGGGDGSGSSLVAGLELHRGGNLQAAMAIYRAILATDPGNADALNLLGVAEAQLRQYDHAIEHLGRAIMIDGQVPAYYENLGSALRDTGDLAAAVGCFREAAGRWPDNASLRALLADVSRRAAIAHNENGIALMHVGRLPEAHDEFERALHLLPDAVGVLLNQAHVSQALCAWSRLDSQWSRIRAAVSEMPDGSVSPFYFLCIPSTAEEQLLCARAWDSVRTEPLGSGPHARRHPAGSSSHGRLRIGYLSSDFREHAVAHLIAELFERHDRTAVHVTAYSTGPDDGSALRSRIMSAVDDFVDLTGIADPVAAGRIAADEIDILLDLNGHTEMERPRLLALHPAPVQVNYLGYPGSSGAPYMDYIIVDRFIAPPAQRDAYGERLAYMPDCYQPNDRMRSIAAELPSRSICGLPDAGFVFSAFNQSYKITPNMFQVWMRILAATPASVLWLLDSNAWATENLKLEAQRAGISSRRLVFAPKMAMPQHLARQRLADLFLDTLPVNGHTTTSDALWVGLPVLTCAGSTFASRVAGSLLHAVGLPELVTTSLREYEALAVELAHDPRRLAGLRNRLRANRDQALLFDCARYTRNLEALFRRMWDEYTRGAIDREPLSV